MGSVNRCRHRNRNRLLTWLHLGESRFAASRLPDLPELHRTPPTRCLFVTAPVLRRILSVRNGKSNRDDTRMTTSPRYQSIDALRGVAALMVMILHVGAFFAQLPGVTGNGVAVMEFFEKFDIGRMGITVFFIISGFVIPKSIRLKQNRPIGKFVIKRFYRLYPLFWFSMILGLFAIWYLHDRSVTGSLIMANVTMIPAFFSEPFIIGLYWTLETELIFYLLMIILTGLGVLRKLPVYLVLTFLLYLLLIFYTAVPDMQPSLPHWTAAPYHLSLMFLGVIYRHLHDDDHWTWGWHRWKLTTGSLYILQLLAVLSVPLLILLQFFISRESTHLPDAIAYLLGIAIFFTGILLWKHPPQLAVYLGIISYSIYLLHPVVFGFLSYLVAESTWFRDLHLGIYILLSLLLTFILCHFSYRLIERPFNNYGHRLVDRIRQNQ